MSVEVTVRLSYPVVAPGTERVGLLAGSWVGKVVKIPSTLICPPVAEAGIAKV